MKTAFLSIVLILCGLSFYSCSNEEEVYSCDPEANEWAKENKSEITKMTRSEWKSMENSVLQKAAYLAFTPSQKHQFWLQKIEEVMLLDWNEKELKHINDLYVFISNNSTVFDVGLAGLYNEERKEFEIFTYKWAEYAENTLGWDKKVYANIAASGYALLNKNGDVVISQNNNKILKLSGEICNCRSVQDIFTTCTNCHRDYRECDKTTDCGFFWTEECDAMCLDS